ncbi:hypothetical protein [Flavobacterium sp. B183]|uniref:hypothetical protein n=1 Tax=Flavobacterium sp. B183 TaxID=907046 RepID=UPI00201F80A4|nr:hypothetical protein [Flavobacterium sp. B183]URC11006.1 hypothetical protein M4I44_12975 [Flavobacterium sp. B183]
MQDAVNQQQGKTVAGGASTYYNSALTYSLGYPQKELSFNGSINNTYGQTDGGKSFIIGPTVGASKLFFDKKLNANASTSYNTSYNNGRKQNDIFNFRLNGSYIYLEKHNFNMSVITLFNKTATGKNNDMTATLSYSYSFDKIKMRPKREPRTEGDMNLTSILKINLNGKALEGTRDQITAQLKEMQLALNPLPEKESTNLEHLLTLASLTPDDKQFKEKVLDYLEAYNIEAENVKKYKDYVLEAAKKLETEMKDKDASLENAYVSALGRVNSHKLHGVNEENITDKTAYKSYQKLVERSNKNRDQLTRHRWMLKEISALTKLPAAEIQQNPAAVVFSAEEMEEAFKSIKEKKSGSEIIAAIEVKMIPFYHDLALKNANIDEIDLNHIQK